MAEYFKEKEMRFSIKDKVMQIVISRR